MKKKPRLTVGCRARFLTLKETPKQNCRNYHDKGSWCKEYSGREVLLIERDHQSFFVMLLGEGVQKLKKKDPHTVENQMAWVPERDLVLVDQDFDANLDFIDWYQEHEEDFCGDCGAWRPGNHGMNIEDCPNKDCPGNHLEDYEDKEDI